MEEIQIYLQSDWVMPLIKWHHRRMKKDGITPKELEVIGKKVGITAKTRSAYEQHLKKLTRKKGYMRKLKILRDGCRIFELTDKGVAFYGTLSAMKTLPVAENRDRVKSNPKPAKAVKAVWPKPSRSYKKVEAAEQKWTKRDVAFGYMKNIDQAMTDYRLNMLGLLNRFFPEE
jgi:hypothetical protein